MTESDAFAVQTRRPSSAAGFPVAVVVGGIASPIPSVGADVAL